MKVQIPTYKGRFLKDYLNTINGILKLTQTEIKVCEVFLKLDLNNPCSKDNRLKAAEHLNWSRAVLNNSIKSLKDKKVLLYDPSKKIRYTFHPLVYNYKANKVLTFEFKTADGL